MDDRNSRYGRRDQFGPASPDYGTDFGSERAYTQSSARDYAAAGVIGTERQGYGARASRDDWNERSYGTQGQRSGQYGGYGPDRDFNRDDQPRGGYGRADYGRSDYGRGDYGRSDLVRSDYSRNEYGRGYQYGRPTQGWRDDQQDRGFFERAGDEVRSWFGDEEAERRRELDQRYDERLGRGERSRGAIGHDDHYTSWRRERIAELDRDYDEYRRENSKRFGDEFNTWRTDRQGQRSQLERVTEHMEVVGSDGSQVGTVDKVRGDRILLTKSDAGAGGHHHSIPSRWIQTVDDKVTLRKTADEAKAHWRDEERAGALFGDNGDTDRNWQSDRNLNRSFSGTY